MLDFLRGVRLVLQIVVLLAVVVGIGAAGVGLSGVLS